MYMESRKMVLMNLHAGQEQRWNTVGEGEGGRNCERSMDTYTLPLATQLTGGCCRTQGAQGGAGTTKRRGTGSGVRASSRGRGH